MESLRPPRFYIHDEVLGPIRVASVLPFRPTYDLNGHNFIEHPLRHGKMGFRKSSNAFVAVDAVLQATADKLGPDIIRKTVGLLDLHPRPEIRGPHRNASLSPQQVL